MDTFYVLIGGYVITAILFLLFDLRSAFLLTTFGWFLWWRTRPKRKQHDDDNDKDSNDKDSNDKDNGPPTITMRA